MTLSETLKRHNLIIRRGFDYDTINVQDADPEKVYNEILNTADKYVSINRMGKLIILYKR